LTPLETNPERRTCTSQSPVIIMMIRAFCVLACFLAIGENISAQATQSDNSQIVTFTPCEFCTPITTGFCCQLGRGCCPQYNKCRSSLVCKARTSCAISNCPLGCCKFDDGTCCPWGSAVLVMAPWFGVVTIPPTGSNITHSP